MGEVKVEQANILKFVKQDVQINNKNMNDGDFKAAFAEFGGDFRNTENAMKDTVSGSWKKVLQKLLVKLLKQKLSSKRPKLLQKKVLGLIKKLWA